MQEHDKSLEAAFVLDDMALWLIRQAADVRNSLPLPFILCVLLEGDCVRIRASLLCLPLRNLSLIRGTKPVYVHDSVCGTSVIIACPSVVQE